MNNICKKIQGLVIMICMVAASIGIYYVPVYAASGNVSIAVSASQLNVGDTVNVTVTVSSDAPIGAYSMAVSYDPSVLEYTGGDGNGGGGTVSIAGYGDGSTARLSAGLSFRAIANGRSSIATSGSDAYAYDESVLSLAHASTVITVAAPATTATNTQASTSQATASSNSEASTETTEAKDTSLKSLEISPGTLVPSFSPSVTKYSVQLPEDATSIIVSALAKDSTASVTVTHHNDLEPGYNQTYIVVTATNGAQTTYTLNITCGEVDETQEVIIKIDGSDYTPASEKDMESVTVPDGLQPVSLKYQGKELNGYATSDHMIRMVYLLNEDREGAWYIYEEASEIFYPYVEVPVIAGRYVVLKLPADVTLPVGYNPVDLNINGNPVMAYVRDSQDELVLVYASNMVNGPGLYLYDKKESTFQRYLNQDQGSVVTTEASTEPEPEIVTEELPAEVAVDQVKFVRVRTLLYIVCVIVVLLLIVLMIMLMIIKKRMPEEDAIEVFRPDASANDFTDED